MSVRTIYLTKDDVEYELEVERDRWGGLEIQQVTVIQGGILKPETDIDPEVFDKTLTENDWSRIREATE